MGFPSRWGVSSMTSTPLLTLERLAEIAVELELDRVVADLSTV